MDDSPEGMRRLHIALEQSGTIGGAAGLLGVRPDHVRRLIDRHPELRSYLPGATFPGHVETIARKPIRPPADMEKERVANAMREADEQVRSGFEAIGVTGDALTQAMAFKDFGRMHFQDMRHYIGGGMAKLFADMMAETKAISEEIARCGHPQFIDREKMLREDRSRCVKHLIDIHDRVREGALTTAVIEAKKAEAKHKRVAGKAAFPPLAMAVKGNVTVHSGSPVGSNVSSDDVK